jgi:hypothetical protein
MMKYLYRLTVWGRHIQIWWYAYTSADYLLKYNGNWFNPVYDLTTLRYSAGALPVGKSKVKRLEKLFLNSTIVPSRVAMIQPITSMLFQSYRRWTSFNEMLSLHTLLFERNDLYELIPETYFLDGRAKLSDFDVIILPYAPYFPDGLAERLAQWVRQGGFLIATGPFGLYDKFGFDTPEFWTSIFNAKPPRRTSKTGDAEWRWSLSKGKAPELLEGRLGKGRVLVTLRSIRNAATRERVTPRLLDLLRQAAPPAARCRSNRFEMTLHRQPDGGQFLCVLNRDVDHPVTDRITLRGEFRRGIDLDVPGGMAIPFAKADSGSSFQLRLDPCEFTVIRLEE